MYTKITNPSTGKKVSINGKIGKSILKKYLKIQKGGASLTENDAILLEPLRNGEPLVAVSYEGISTGGNGPVYHYFNEESIFQMIAHSEGTGRPVRDPINRQLITWIRQVPANLVNRIEHIPYDSLGGLIWGNDDNVPRNPGALPAAPADVAPADTASADVAPVDAAPGHLQRRVVELEGINDGNVDIINALQGRVMELERQIQQMQNTAQRWRNNIQQQARRHIQRVLDQRSVTMEIEE